MLSNFAYSWPMTRMVVTCWHLYIPILDTQSYVLNFHGRVTQASVKNFQIIHNANRNTNLFNNIQKKFHHFSRLHCHAIWSREQWEFYNGFPLSIITTTSFRYRHDKLSWKIGMRVIEEQNVLVHKVSKKRGNFAIFQGF
jgi:hypothetical protein